MDNLTLTKKIRVDLDEAVKAIAKKYNIQSDSIGGITYNDASIRGKWSFTTNVEKLNKDKDKYYGTEGYHIGDTIETRIKGKLEVGVIKDWTKKGSMVYEKDGQLWQCPRAGIHYWKVVSKKAEVAQLVQPETEKICRVKGCEKHQIAGVRFCIDHQSVEARNLTCAGCRRHIYCLKAYGRERMYKCGQFVI